MRNSTYLLLNEKGKEEIIEFCIQKCVFSGSINYLLVVLQICNTLEEYH